MWLNFTIVLTFPSGGRWRRPYGGDERGVSYNSYKITKNEQVPLHRRAKAPRSLPPQGKDIMWIIISNSSFVITQGLCHLPPQGKDIMWLNYYKHLIRHNLKGYATFPHRGRI
jgi:hypothetical protein